MMLLADDVLPCRLFSFPVQVPAPVLVPVEVLIRHLRLLQKIPC